MECRARNGLEVLPGAAACPLIQPLVGKRESLRSGIGCELPLECAAHPLAASLRCRAREPRANRARAHRAGKIRLPRPRPLPPRGECVREAIVSLLPAMWLGSGNRFPKWNISGHHLQSFAVLPQHASLNNRKHNIRLVIRMPQASRRSRLSGWAKQSPNPKPRAGAPSDF